MVNLVFVPQMEAVADFYETSPFYQGELTFTYEEFQKSSPRGKTLIIGRNGRYHHQDINHYQMLRNKELIPEGQDLSLVLFDRHDDYGGSRKDNHYVGLGMGDWVGYGIYHNLFSHAVILAHSDSMDNEIKWFEEGVIDSHKIMKWFREVEVYLCGGEVVNDRFYPEAEDLLKTSHCIKSYEVIGGKYVKIYFKSHDEASYERTKSRLVVSTDLDILNQSEMEVDFLQGGLTTEGLETLIARVPKKVDAAIVSGFTEQTVKRTTTAMNNMCRILAAHSKMLE